MYCAFATTMRHLIIEANFTFAIKIMCHVSPGGGVSLTRLSYCNYPVLILCIQVGQERTTTPVIVFGGQSVDYITNSSDTVIHTTR